MSNLEGKLKIVLPQVITTTSLLTKKQEFMKSDNIGALSLGVNPVIIDSRRFLVLGDRKP